MDYFTLLVYVWTDRLSSVKADTHTHPRAIAHSDVAAAKVFSQRGENLLSPLKAAGGRKTGL